jgi:flagellar biosynthetic protein FlhB
MAEEAQGGERTEEPTPRRLQKALDEGRIAQSRELAVAGSLLAAAVAVRTLLPAAGESLRDLLARSLAGAGTFVLTPASAAWLLSTVARQAATAVIVPLGVVALIGVAPALIQWRGLFAGKAFDLKWERINPIANGRRLITPAQFVELAKSFAKLALVSAVVVAVLRRSVASSVALAQSSPLAFGPFIQQVLGRLFLFAGLAYLALAALDYGWQWWRHHQSLRMTRDEVRRETKEDQGDPMIRVQRRQMARQNASNRMMKDVKTASVVVTNPTHIAVALRYDEVDAPVPVVVAIGRDKVAERIKEIARDAGVPLVENKPVARALLRRAQVGSVIPVELYVAVAEIIAYVIRTRQTRGHWFGSARG